MLMLKFVSLTAAVALLATPALAQSDTAAPAAKPIRTTTGMMRYDANKDGIVDRAEWNAGQQARFQELDKNGDGKISAQEFSPGGTTDKREAAFRRLDADRDGAVTQTEFMAQADRNFARCDSDKDGKITTAECRQALQRKPVDKAKAER
jgi:hypothetical protein